MQLRNNRMEEMQKARGGVRGVSVQLPCPFWVCHSPCETVTREGTPLGPDSGLLSNSQKWIVQGDTRTDVTKPKTLLERGARVEKGRLREPRRTALPCGSRPQVLWQWNQLSWLSLFYGSKLTSIHDYWKNCRFDAIELFWQSDVFAF